MNTKKLIAILLALVTVLAITAACSKEKNEEEVATIVDENGKVVETVSYSVEYVVDENGDKVINKDTLEQETIIHHFVEVTDKNGVAVTGKDNEKVTQEYTTEFDFSEMTTVEVETLPQGKPVEQNKKLLEKAFSSGAFYMEMSVENELKMPMKMTFATSGENLYFAFDINLGFVKMGYGALQKDGKSYAIDKTNKQYCVSDSATSNTADIEDMLSTIVVDSNANYIKSSEVTFKGKAYICEEYKTQFGVSKYYFDKNTEALSRIEHQNSDVGNVIVVDKFVRNPGDSYFAVPSGYKKVSEEEFNKSFEQSFGSLPF